MGICPENGIRKLLLVSGWIEQLGHFSRLALLVIACKIEEVALLPARFLFEKPVINDPHPGDLVVRRYARNSQEAVGAKLFYLLAGQCDCRRLPTGGSEFADVVPNAPQTPLPPTSGNA